MKEVFSPELAAGTFLSNVVRYIDILWEGEEINALEKGLKIRITSNKNDWAYIYLLAVYLSVANQSLEVHFNKQEAEILKNALLNRIDSADIPMKDELIIAIKQFEEVIALFPNYKDNFPICLERDLLPFDNLSEAIGLAYAECSDIDLTMTFNNTKTYNLFSAGVIGDFIFLVCSRLHWGTLLEEFGIDFRMTT